MADFDLIPHRTALINVDMQNCFVEGSPISAPEGLVVLDRINRVAEACRRAGILVIHTSHVLRPDGSNTGVLGEIAPIAKSGIINKGSQSAALRKGLTVDAHDVLLDKPRFGSFHGITVTSSSAESRNKKCNRQDSSPVISYRSARSA
jgi:ureidoacrylate peracid hydrolase